MTTSRLINVALAGVGGQGSILAGRIIARSAEIDGHDVASSEVHGMSQRGGSVFSTVRYSPLVLSPMIPRGEADVLLAFEQLESLRYLDVLTEGGIVVVNDQRIPPTLESLKSASYPDGVVEILRRHTDRVGLVPGLEWAVKLCNPKLANAVVLGVLSSLLDLSEDAWRQALREIVPRSTVDLNLAAFEAGIAWIETEKPVQPV